MSNGLAFGTGGIRALMGPGLDKMNSETVALATAAFSAVLKKHNHGAMRVAISYDSRHHSREFAEQAAAVLIGAGIEVLLTKELRPTPFLSFLCRHHNCAGGIMITASHNSPEYNGYKVYWRGGRQVTHPYDSEIVAAIAPGSKPKKASLHSPLFKESGEEDDNAYLAALTGMKGSGGKALKIVYTSLHGTGTPLAQEALRLWGFEHIHSLEKQCLADGDFPTCKNPNPETDNALQLGMDTLLKEKGDILLATDPDADRMGSAVMHKGKVIHLTGDEIGSLLLDHLLLTRKIPKNGAVISTVVTTRLIKKMTEKHGLHYCDTLIGFKYIAEKIEEWEKEDSYKFIFGAEQSLGYLYAGHARDKDGLASGCLLAEAAQRLQLEGKTLVDRLHELEKIYGVHHAQDASVTLESISHYMDALRSDPPETLGPKEVVCVRDYLKGIEGLPPSDMLAFELEGGYQAIVRPSGTEPKVKIYASGTDKETLRLIIHALT